MGANASTIADSLTQQFHKLDKDSKRGYLVRVVCLERARDQLARCCRRRRRRRRRSRTRSQKKLPRTTTNNQKRI